jgi:hypothetical protein
MSILFDDKPIEVDDEKTQQALIKNSVKKSNIDTDSQ